MAGSHELIAKTTFYEESSKIPIIIRYPKQIQPNTTNDKALVGTIDLMPTILDLAGIKIPDSIDGLSFKNEIIEPKAESTRFNVLYSQNQFGRMVRFDNFKYVKTFVYGQTYDILYDLINDPLESKNLLNNSLFEDDLEKGRRLLDNWLTKEGIPLVIQK